MKQFIAMLIIIAALFASSIVVHAGTCASEDAVFVGSKAAAPSPSPIPVIPSRW